MLEQQHIYDILHYAMLRHIVYIVDIYIYIYMYVCVCVYIYILQYIVRSAFYMLCTIYGVGLLRPVREPRSWASSISLSLSIYISLSISLSLSIYIYIYIYRYVLE